MVWLLTASSPNIFTAFQFTGIPWMYQAISYCRAFVHTLPSLNTSPSTLYHVNSYSCSNRSFSEPILPIIPSLFPGTSHKLQSCICLCAYLLIIFLCSLSPCRLEFSCIVQYTKSQHLAQCLAHKKTSEDNGNRSAYQLIPQMGLGRVYAKTERNYQSFSKMIFSKFT